MIEEYEGLYKPLKETYDELEDRLIRNIGKRLDVNDENGGSDEWQLRKLSQTGSLTNENEKSTRRLTKKASGQLEELYVGIGYGEVEKDEKIYLQAVEAGKIEANPVSYTSDPALKKILSNSLIKSNDHMNLTNTTALESASKDFVDIVNKAYLEVSNGVKDYKTSIRDSIGKLADKGITAQRYTLPNGSIMTMPLDAAIRREVLTTTAQTAREMQDQRADEYGSDLIEVSSHAGAREGCAPYQGKIYSRSGESKKYTAIADTSVGEPGGLFGINCGHAKYPFFDGLNYKTYQPTKSKKQEEKKYKESQQQRKLEVDVRMAKKRLVAYDACNDKEGYEKWSVKLGQKQKKLNSFMKQTGREQTPRTETYGFNKRLSNRSRYYINKESES